MRRPPRSSPLSPHALARVARWLVAALVVAVLPAPAMAAGHRAVDGVVLVASARAETMRAARPAERGAARRDPRPREGARATSSRASSRAAALSRARSSSVLRPRAASVIAHRRGDRLYLLDGALLR